MILLFQPFSKPVTVATGWHGRSGHAEHWRQETFKAEAAAFQPSAGTWMVAPTQRWLTDTVFARATTEEIVAPLRSPFARHVVGLLASGDSRAEALQRALTRLDHVLVAWRGYERLALGECFASASNYAAVQAAEGLVQRQPLVRLLQDGRLMDFVRALDPVSADVRAALPLARGRLGACSRIPPDVDAAIDALDRYVALRNAEY
jgi:hypothetical protein